MSGAAPPSNFRDLGGLHCTHGYLAPGRLLRGALHDRSVTALPASRNLRHMHVFDLRGEHEVVGSEEPDGTTHRHAWPIQDSEWTSDPTLRTDDFFVASAVRQLRLVGPLLGEALEILAAGGSVLIGCRLGKDRTGMTVLALGRLLGLDDDELVDDYCRTGEAYGAAPVWVRHYAGRRGEPVAEVARRLAPRPTIPRGILAALDSMELSIIENWDLDPELIRRASSAVTSTAAPLTRGVLS